MDMFYIYGAWVFLLDLVDVHWYPKATKYAVCGPTSNAQKGKNMFYPCASTAIFCRYAMSLKIVHTQSLKKSSHILPTMEVISKCIDY